VDDDHDALMRLAWINVAESQQMVSHAREVTLRYHEFCERVRRQVAADLTLIESLKTACSQTGIIRLRGLPTFLKCRHSSPRRNNRSRSVRIAEGFVGSARPARTFPRGMRSHARDDQFKLGSHLCHAGYVGPHWHRRG
jgi:hypothetical protein